MSTPLAVLLFLALAAPAAAYLAPVGDEIAAARGGSPERPALGATPDGGLLVAWSNASNRHVEVRRYDGVGRPFGRARTLSVRGEGPALAVDELGGALVVWRQLVADGSLLLGRRLDADGAPRGQLLRLGDPSPAIDSAPALALAPDGGFAVAWTERSDDGEASGVRLRLFDAAGTPAGPALAVDGGADGLHRLGGLARIDGGWVIAWEERPPGFALATGSVWQRTLSADGGALSPPRRLDDGSAELVQAPVVARLGEGWATAWTGFDTAGIPEVVTRRFAAGGEPGAPPLVVARSPGTSISQAPSLTQLAGGGWLVAWGEALGGDAARTRLYARAFAADGTPAGDPFEIAPEAANAGDPAAVALAGGGAAVAWSERPGDGVGELRWRHLEAPCVGAAATLCLGDGRFRARVTYTDPFGGGGDGVALPRGERWGSFWFFRPSNVELAVKVLDARKISGNFWVFYASLTNVAFTLTVVDVETGNRRVYVNPAGTLASRGDTGALPGERAEDRALAARRSNAPPRRAAGDLPDLRPALVPLPAADEEAGCRPGPDRLCLGAGGRFAVEATWHDFDHGQGAAGALPQTTDTGALWFFDPGNPELIVKVLDGRAVNGSFWVFYGALTNVAFDLVVRDTATGREVRYENPLGTFASRGDTGAFAR